RDVTVAGEVTLERHGGYAGRLDERRVRQLLRGLLGAEHRRHGGVHRVGRRRIVDGHTTNDAGQAGLIRHRAGEKVSARVRRCLRGPRSGSMVSVWIRTDPRRGSSKTSPLTRISRSTPSMRRPRPTGSTRSPFWTRRPPDLRSPCSTRPSLTGRLGTFVNSTEADPLTHLSLTRAMTVGVQEYRPLRGPGIDGEASRYARSASGYPGSTRPVRRQALTANAGAGRASTNTPTPRRRAAPFETGRGTEPNPPGREELMWQPP